MHLFYSTILRNTFTRLFSLTAAVLFFSTASSATIYYVDAARPDNNGAGTSWATAKKDLQDAIDIAMAGDEIWVKTGIYAPTKPASASQPAPVSRDRSFLLKNGVKLYGGFAGTETIVSQRNPSANPVILTAATSSTFGNSFHVVVSVNDNASTILDGFNIRNGDARIGDPVPFSAQTIEGASVSTHVGGGIVAINSSLTVSNCLLQANKGTRGGGIFIVGAPQLINCIIAGNITNPGNTSLPGQTSYGGGVAVAGGSSPLFTNCTIAGNNTVSSGAGGIANYGNLTLNNSVVDGNNIGLEGNEPINNNSIIEESDLLSLYMPAAPSYMLAPFSGGNFTPAFCSPLINGGNNALVPPGISTDVLSNPRITGGAVDVGAIELTSTATSSVIYVNGSVGNSGDGRSWATAFKTIDEALNAANGCDVDTIFIARGGYFPAQDVNANNSPADPRDKTFFLKTDVKIFGGFFGNETSISQRNITANPTILNGSASNSYHVLLSVYNTSEMVLDGLTIISGNSGTPGTYTIVNGRQVDRSIGAGLNCTYSSPVIRNCTFQSNTGIKGGGIGGDHANPQISNCIFAGNRRTIIGSYGTAIWLSGQDYPYLTTKITNCTFSGNDGIADAEGTVYITQNKTAITNCIFWENDPAAGDIRLAANPEVTVSNSIVQTGFPGAGNLIADPQFVNAPSYTTAPFTGGDYRVSLCSPSLNSGDNTAVPPTTLTDINGLPRIRQYIVDMGPYELLSVKKLYVNGAVAASGDGLSWGTALKTIQEALEDASVCTDSIFVAAGTYFPAKDPFGNASPADPRDKAFVLRSDIKIYGGFTGTETSLSERNLSAATSILSGDIGVAGNSSDNCYHVVISSNNSSETLLDGFTIKSGNANGAGSITVDGNTVSRSSGGGILVTASGTVVQNCIISGNTAAANGGGIGITNNSFPFLYNSIISGNLAAAGAGASVEGSSSADIRHTTIVGNNAPTGGGLNIGSGSNTQLVNSIVFGNSTGINVASGSTASVQYSTVQGGFAGTGNISGDPQFISSPSFATAPFTGGNYQVANCSPVINSGDNTMIPAGYTTDIISNPRISLDITDMGAYEKTPVNGLRFYVNSAIPASGNGLSWAAAFKTLGEALENARLCTMIDTIFVAKGTYTPSYDAFGNNTPANAREKTFYLRNGIKLFGGFAGTETTLAQRNLALNPTILSGDIGLPGNITDNTYHVILSVSDDNNTVVDGFTITGGNADGAGTQLVEGWAVFRSFGGGIQNTNSSPTISYCTISGNKGGNGGGISNYNNSSPYIVNCLISGNLATNGGGINCEGNSSPVILLSTIAGNNAAAGGAIVAATNSGVRVINSILYGNSSGIAAVASTPVVLQSTVQGGYAGTNVTSADPLFLSSPSYTTAPFVNGDYRLAPCSPDINAGTNDFPFSYLVSTDITGSTRIQQSIIDKGAYENTASSSSSFITYVNSSVPVSGNGLSWATAYKTLAEALQAVPSCGSIDTIFVAKGTYFPQYDPSGNASPADARDKTFYLHNGYKLFGGFAGTETNLSQRNLALNQTILSGDLGTPGVSSDNSYHVVLSAGDDANTILDGFIISNGNANGTGGIVTEGKTINRNYGAGVHTASSSLIISNCSITGNSADNGAGLFSDNSSVSVTNCRFTGNSAVNNGGGIFNAGTSSPRFINCTVAGNNAAQGGGLYNSTTGVVCTNSIVYGNSSQITNAPGGTVTVSYSTVQGGYTGTNVTSADPLFESSPSYTISPFTIGDYRLALCSPAINAGNNAAIPAGTITDIRSAARIGEAIVDMGAYENVHAKFRLYVNAANPVPGNGLSWLNAYQSLAQALEYARTCNNVDTIFVAAGTYYPQYDPLGNSNPANARDKTFFLRDGVKVFGGFSGGELNLSDRNLAINTTILSGDIGTVNNRADNSYHVVMSVNDGAATILDGCMITGGNANGTGVFTAENTDVPQNFGGGIQLTGSSVTIRNCNVAGNQGGNGGGLSAYRISSPALINSVFAGNTATTGGGINLDIASLSRISNCTIAGNYAVTGGGIVVSNSTVPVISNSIIYGNNTGITVINANPAVQYSTVQGGFSGNGNNNSAESPIFINSPSYTLAPFTNGDYRLSVCSPAINTGNNSFIPAGISTDIIGAARIQQSTVDKGAYENNPVAAPFVIYVNPLVQSSGNGLSWSTAFRTMSEALYFANKCTSVSAIYAAGGIFYPGYDPFLNANPADPRDRTFYMRNGLKVYGGFAGTETSPAQRNLALNKTILSGDLGLLNSSADNSYHTVLFVNDPATTVLDGVTVADGNANGTGNINVETITVARNLGGGIFMIASQPSIVNCSITGNAAVSGAGIFNNGTPAITNCIIAGNLASFAAGGLYNYNGSSPVITNTTIAGNNAVSGGGGLFNELNSSPTLANCIIYGNSSGLLNSSGSNPAISYSTVQGGYAGTGNISTDPQFAGSPSFASAPFSNGNYKLGACSPALNSGNNALVPAGILSDIISVQRIRETTVDMGAYENLATGLILYVNGAVAASGNGLSWATAFKTVEEALAYSRICTGADSIFVAAGIYYPTHDPFGNASPADPRDKTFYLNNGVKIFGGFQGIENSFAERSLADNITILSGDIGIAGNASDNSYHVITSVSDDNSAALNGFTITGGNANGSGTILVETWAVPRNIGGGTGLTNSSPDIINCRVMGNNAVSGGGIGSYNFSSPAVTNCIIAGNTATAGGGVYSENQSNSLLINCVVAGNNAATGGAARNLSFSNIRMFNTIVYDNSSAIVSNSSSPNIQYSIIQGGFTGTGNSIDDPRFISSPSFTAAPFTNGDYSLMPCSPAINSGLNGFVNPVIVPTDIIGNTRILQTTVDRGAYEYAGPVFTAAVYENTAAATVCNNKTLAGATVHFYDAGCNILASVTPSGASPVSGAVNTCVVTNSLAGPLPLAGPDPYLTRHYDIEPSVNAATATAIVKLYFTQAEFDNYNSKKPAAYPALPAGPADAFGKSNIRIIQYHGTPLSSPSVPGAYTNSAAVSIDPLDNDIVWNGSFWEISIPVTGFSGFYLSTATGILPLQIVYFSGIHSTAKNTLRWKVDCDNAADGTIELQRSTDGIHFAAIHSLPVSPNNCGNEVVYTDMDLQQSIYYYRIRLSVSGGRTVYSSVVILKDQQGGSSIMPVPNPVTGGTLQLLLNNIPAGKVMIRITDAAGRMVYTAEKEIQTGQQQTTLDISRLPSGTYQVSATDRNNNTMAAKIIKL